MDSFVIHALCQNATLLEITCHGSFAFLFSVSCAALSSLANGNISLISDNTNTWAIYTCNVGYTIKGVNRRMCQTDGSWDSTQPECRKYELIAKEDIV